MGLSSLNESRRKFLDEAAIDLLNAGKAAKGHLKVIWGIYVSCAVFKSYPLTMYGPWQCRWIMPVQILAVVCCERK